jgi:hypothetical protein
MTRQEIIQLIQREAQAAQLDPACMVRIAEIESGFNPEARNKSGAAGVYQIMPFHKVDNVFDPLTNIRWAMNFTKQNHEYLRKNGVPISCFTTYLAHQQGADGAVTLWSVRGKRIDELTPKQRKNILANVGGNDFVTVDQFLTFWQRKIMKSPLASLPDSFQIPLARVDSRALAGISAVLLGVATTYAITRFVEKTTVRKAL